LVGKTFVITGTLPSMTREQAAGLIAAHGGKVTGSVTKKTSYLLIGDDLGGAKFTRATELGIPMVDEAGLLAMIGAEARAIEPSEGEPQAADGEKTAQPEADAKGSEGQLSLDL